MTARDRIVLQDLELTTVVGTRPEERENPRRVVLNVTIEGDWRRAGQTDRLDDAVDYLALRNRIAKAVEASTFFLLESLAERVAETCLATPAVRAVTIRVDKPGAVPGCRSVAVEIRREGSDERIG